MSDSEIFISYAWKGESESLVDRICDTFTSQGFQIRRDKSTLTYRDSIREFMDRIGRGKYIIAVVSDKYMKSEYCMYEAYRMFQSPAFRERVFPIVLPDADIFSFRGQAAYLRYWHEEYMALEAEYRSIAEDKPTMVVALTERLRDIEATTRFINDFMDAVGDMNVLTSQMHLDSNFEQLLEAIESRIKRTDEAHTELDLSGGLYQLEVELPIRAPILMDSFHEQARRLRRFLRTQVSALSDESRRERSEAVAAINTLCLEVLDITFDALCAGAEPPAYDDRCPFPGLQSFQPEDKVYFFGREKLTEQLSEKLNTHPFLAVLGASGSGKSSLVMAGLVPALKLEHVIIRPGSDPIKALEAVKEQPLIVVDQFEELFTLTTDPEKRKAFCDRLLGFLPRSRLVLTLRSDFMDEVAELRDLNDQVQNHLVNVPAMDTEELRLAMEGQAKVVGLRFEEGLSSQILEDVTGEPGAMPLLQHALWELWNRRHGRWLKTAEYKRSGGVKLAVTRTADTVYNAYPAAEQEQMRNIFLGLTRLDDSDVRRDTRRRVLMRDLIPEQRNLTATSQLLDRLVQARLIVMSGDGEQATIEVVHESIIQNWSRLRDWINSKRELFIWKQSRLMPALVKWKNTREHFLDDEAAVEAKRWLIEQRSELSALETEFIFHSLLRTSIDIASWLPSFGTAEEILAILESYWKDPSEAKRKLGVQALTALPKSDQEEDVIRRLEGFVFDDPSVDVASLAAHGICRRGQIRRLTDILNQEQLPRPRRDRLIHVLASTRNLPEIGRQVPGLLKKHTWRTWWKSVMLLVEEYQHDLSLIFAITFLVGLFGNIAVSIILQSIDQIILPPLGIRADDPLSIFVGTVGSNDIMIVLIIGILAVIQVRLVDRLPLSKRHFRPAITAAVFNSLIFVLLSLAGYLSDVPDLDVEGLGFFTFSISTNIAVGVREVLTTWILSVFIVRTVFQQPLFLERASIVERSLFASIKCSGLLQIVSIPMSAILQVLVAMVNDRNLLNYLERRVSDYGSFATYFAGISARGFLLMAGDGLRLFIYLLGFYIGLNTAFRDSAVRKQLSESA